MFHSSSSTYQLLTFSLLILSFTSFSQSEFITTWDANEVRTITIPTHGLYTYDYTVDWGDATVTSGHTGDAVHTYATPGTYTVKITGTFPAINFFTFSKNKNQILAIEQWGDIVWETMEGAFYGCFNLTCNATDEPNLSKVTSLVGMFGEATAFNGDLSLWNVSEVTNMKHMFYKATAFNGKLGNWNVSKVTGMSFMFYGATSFNQDIGNWNVSVVNDMEEMFYNASSFNQDISKWNVSMVTNMEKMFYNANSFNQEIGNWDVGEVNNMMSMFYKASAFNGDIGNWEVGNVINMRYMFYEATSFNQDLNSWDVSGINNMENMFNSAISFNGNISNWNVSKVTNMELMFNFAKSFNQDISNWNISEVINMEWMFANCYAFDQDLGSWNIEKVTSMNYMFTGVNLSTTNYDALLNGWSQQNVQPGIKFLADKSQYCLGESGRTDLTDIHGWTITDGGIGTTDSKPVVNPNITFEMGSTASALTATLNKGEKLNWYDSLTDDIPKANAPVPSTDKIGIQEFFVSEGNLSGSCEGPREKITVTIKEKTTSPPVYQQRITANNFEILLEDTKTLTEQKAINLANAKATLVPGGGPLKVSVSEKELEEIQKAEAASYYKLTFKAPNGASMSISVKVITAEEHIMAYGFEITMEEAANLSANHAINLAKATAISLPDSTILEVKVNEAELKAINDASTQGEYPLSFSSPDGSMILVTVTVTQKTEHITANDFEIALADAGSLTDNMAINLSGAKAISLPDSTILEIKVNEADLSAIKSATEKGIYTLRFSTPNDTLATVNVTIVEESVVEKEEQITANDFVITLAEAGTLTNSLAIRLAEAKAISLPDSTTLEIKVNEADLTAINNATEKGNFILRFSTPDNTLAKVTVTIKDESVIVREEHITAYDFEIDLAEAASFTDVQAITLAEAKATSLPDNSILEVTVNQTDLSAIRAATAEGSYTLRFNSPDGTEAVVTVNIITDLSADLFIPEGFSPNGDGINDYWIIKGLDTYPEAKMKIYSRWGSLIYKNDHYGNTELQNTEDAYWNGKANLGLSIGSGTVPTATYIYILELGNGQIKSGTVYVVKSK